MSSLSMRFIILVLVFMALPVSAAIAGSVSNTPAEVARGKYLVRIGDCMACHTQRGSQKFAGGRPIQTPFGIIYTPNITPDRETGIGNWTDEEFYKALHDGIAPGGVNLYPAFPYPSFTYVTEKDVLAIKAYLYSLSPVKKKDRKSKLKWPYDIRSILTVWDSLYLKKGPYREDLRRSKTWNRGAYLVEGLGHCGACHTPRNALGAEKKGSRLKGASYQGWFAPHLDVSRMSDVHNWTETELVDFLRYGFSRTKGVALGPMQDVVHDSTQYINQNDLQAIAIYLISLGETTRKNPVPGDKDAPGAAIMIEKGLSIYKKHCSGCHQDSGEGLSHAYPALKGNPIVLNGNPTDVINVVLQGGFETPTRFQTEPYSMPSFAHQLTAVQVASVINYIRNSWGNSAPPVTARQIRDSGMPEIEPVVR
jgi:mono/diheme cytochrome c family protein